MSQSAAEGPLFEVPVSCSSLAQPDFDRFIAYSRPFFDAHRYTNNGPVAIELERRLAAFHQTKRCVVFCTGFWGLVLGIRALALPGRDEVVLPSFTYRRMADIVAWAGLVPRFCDIDRETLAISAQTAAAVVGPRTALILAVHPIVNCCRIDELEDYAAEAGIPLLIDGVESCYETYRGRRIGTFGRAEVFSLHASKLINGFDGGYVTTDDDALAEQLRFMRGFGFVDVDRVEYFGSNAKFSEVHAAMTLANLDELEQLVAANRERYRAYQRELSGVDGLRLLEFDESERTSFKNIVVELGEPWPLTREVTVALLNAQNILARAYYSPPLHRKPYTYEVRFGELPVTDEYADRLMLLPCGTRTSLADVGVICAYLRELAAAERTPPPEGL